MNVLGPAMSSESAASPATNDANHCSKGVNAYRYTFEYPASWKNDVVNKVSFAHLYVSGMQASSHLLLPLHHVLTDLIVHLQTEKGMQGIDSRVINPKIGKSRQLSCCCVKTCS